MPPKKTQTKKSKTPTKKFKKKLTPSEKARRDVPLTMITREQIKKYDNDGSKFANYKKGLDYVETHMNKPYAKQISTQEKIMNDALKVPRQLFDSIGGKGPYKFQGDTGIEKFRNMMSEYSKSGKAYDDANNKVHELRMKQAKKMGFESPSGFYFYPPYEPKY